MRTLLLMVLLAGRIGADDADPYRSWQQGRPEEALPVLLEHATRSDDWRVWFDAGLAAADADKRGVATACLARAFLRDPAQEPSRQALALVSGRRPDSWCSLLGPLVLPATGLTGLTLCLIAGCCLGYALCRRRHRVVSLAVFLLPAILILPGRIAIERDARLPLVAVLADGDLLDPSGRPVGSVVAGELISRRPGAVWNGNLPVERSDGTGGGFLPQRIVVEVAEADAMQELGHR